MTLLIIGSVLGFVAGAAVIWFFKERIQALVIDVNTISRKLHEKADQIAKL